MHQNGFAHRDLKPGNILIKSMPPNDKWWIVLADFGISKRADETSGPSTAIGGTAAFMAPELLGYLDHAKPKSMADFKAADMWALGEILFQMLTGETTFRNPFELIQYCVGQQEFPSNRLPIAARGDSSEFIAGIMTALPQGRMTAAQCIQHHWIESLRMKEEISALDFKQSGPPRPNMYWNEPASAQWSTLSNPENIVQNTSQWEPAMPINPITSSVKQTEIHFNTTLPSSRPNPNADRGSTISTEMTLVHTLEGHGDTVWAVAFSPDSKHLVSASSDSKVRLWDTSAGTLAQTLEATFPLYAVAFSPDGKRLAFAARNDAVELWDTEFGTLVHTLRGHSHVIFALAFSPNSSRLAFGLVDCSVWIWDAGRGTLVHTLEGHLETVWGLAFSPDGKWLVSASCDCTVKIWNADFGTLVRTLKGHSGRVRAVAFSPDGTRLASASDHYTVQLWDTGAWTPVQTIKGHSEMVWSVAFSPDGMRLASASFDRTVRLWDVGAGTLVQTLEGHSNGVCAVAFSPDGKLLASASKDRTVRLWDTRART